MLCVDTLAVPTGTIQSATVTLVTLKEYMNVWKLFDSSASLNDNIIHANTALH